MLCRIALPFHLLPSIYPNPTHRDARILASRCSGGMWHIGTAPSVLLPFYINLPVGTPAKFIVSGDAAPCVIKVYARGHKAPQLEVEAAR